MTRTIELAIAWATELHRGQTRKGSDVPYVFHVLTVGGLVAEAGGDEAQIVAAILHDAVEDAGGEPVRAEIQDRFGRDVTELVMACSEPVENPTPTWKVRKTRFLETLPSLSDRALLVCLADKLHNARSITGDLHRLGERVWERFSGRREGTLWYYRTLSLAMRQRLPANPMSGELTDLVRSWQHDEARDSEAPPGD